MGADPPPLPFVFCSSEGQELVRKVVSDALPYVPHDHQVNGVCKLLDGIDVVAVLPTGSGKTTYYVMYTLMLLALSANPSLCDPPYKCFTRDPCLIMVYPTNGLEEEQAVTFAKAGIQALVINRDTVSRARSEGINLWAKARKDISVLLLSPEQLASPGFEHLLQHRSFYMRICGLGVDEIHLLYSWGLQFRKSFRHMGYIRPRLPPHARFIGTTATLLVGKPQDTVLDTLGLRIDEFYFPRHSNIRHNVRTIFRTLTHGLGGWAFPDLRWILDGGRKTVIHCRTITLGFRVAIYLWHLCPARSRSKRIRLYNALNWPSYNTETRDLMQHDRDAQVIVATASFMVGIDLPNIEDIVILGALQSADEHVQWEGRAGRDPELVKDARCITYTSKKTQAAARALRDGTALITKKSSSGKKSAAVQMEASMARLLLAACATDEQNELYGNPPSDPPCSCSRCTPSLPSSMDCTDPSPYLRTCRCSGCAPEESLGSVVSTKRTDTNPVPRRKRLKKVMRAAGVEHLERVRMKIYRATSTATSRSLTPEAYLPDSLIKTLLDRFALVETKDSLREFIKGRALLLPHLNILWEACNDLAGLFEEMRSESNEKAEGHLEDAAARVQDGMHVQSLSFEECCSQFEVDTTTTSTPHDEESQL
ncbi:P-loop containing nucleoside triphosphate hydrolase protein [Trametes sanguinea]|nr:P-loop containing nucleoside triphosphate hydrolase protein [Trametes sanguinea]KAI9069579.1 P-loop containing nucleoside triphosphate hydrolase protein [Trametes sanguinea]